MISRFKEKVDQYATQKRVEKIERNRPLLSNFSGKTICIFSNPRGGSTWLSEMISSSGDFISIIEPLFQGKYRTDHVMPIQNVGRDHLKDFNYWFYQPITNSIATEQDLIFFQNLFSGKHLDPKLTAYSNTDQLRSFKQVLVKFCYANLMLPWVTENFNVAAVLLLRHPCAVVSSQLKVKGAFEHILQHPKFHIPHFRGSEYFDQYNDILKKIKRPEENLAAIWAITVKHLVTDPINNKKWLTLKYESILTDPTKHINKIKEAYPDFIWSKNKINPETPSRTTLDKNLKNHMLKGTQLLKWKEELTQSQIANVLAVVKDFEVDLYD